MVEPLREEKRINLESHITSNIAFSSDGKYIAAGLEVRTFNTNYNKFNEEYVTNYVVQIWSTDTGELVKTLEGHTRKVKNVAFRNDGKYLVSGSDDYTVKIWSTKNGKLYKTFIYEQKLKREEDKNKRKQLPKNAFPEQKRISSVAFTYDGQHLMVSKIQENKVSDVTIMDYDIKTEESKNYDMSFTDFPNLITTDLIFSPKMNYAAVGVNSKVKLFDLKNLKNDIITLEDNKEDNSFVTCLAFSPDGKFVASGSQKGWVKIWNIEKKENIQTMNNTSENINSVAFSPDGYYVVSVSGLGKLSNYNELVFSSIETGQIVNSNSYPPTTDRKFINVIFSPDGKYVAANRPGCIILFNNPNVRESFESDFGPFTPIFENDENLPEGLKGGRKKTRRRRRSQGSRSHKRTKRKSTRRAHKKRY